MDSKGISLSPRTQKPEAPEGGATDFLLPRLLRRRKDNPDEICAHFLGSSGAIESSLTLGRWLDLAELLGTELLRRGIKKGDRILLGLPTSEEFLISFLGLWWIGAVPVPLPEPSAQMKRGRDRERLIHVIADCQPEAMIVRTGGAEVLLESLESKEELKKLLIWEWSELLPTLETSHNQVTLAEQEKKEGPEHWPSFWKDPLSIALLQYTSGSTEAAKGVVITQANLLANCVAVGSLLGLGIRQDDLGLSWIPLYHDMGLIGGVLLPSYYFHFPLFLLPTPVLTSNPKLWFQIISEHRITVSTSPNFFYNFCAKKIDPKDIPSLDLSCWRVAFNGAEPIDSETLSNFQKKFGPYGFSSKALFPVYGMAEATLAISIPPIDSSIQIDLVQRKALIQSGAAIPADPNQSSLEETLTSVSVGRCLPHHELKIKDHTTGRVLGDRQVGEICFTGPSVSPGYFRDQNWLKTPRPSQELATGDLGYLADGNLYIVDRIKDLILIGGVNFYPTDIENEVSKIDGLQAGRIVALGAFEKNLGTSVLIIIAEIHRKSEPELLTQKIRKHLLATHGIAPRDVVLSKHRFIPLTTSGKVMRKKSLELYLKGELLPAKG